MDCCLEGLKGVADLWRPDSIERSIPERFEEQVVANREGLAVWAGEGTLTYGALNEGANRLARAVLANAPKAETVAVLIGQGASVIMAMLGVWKAGKIFVPLDARQPTARMLQILDDCQPGLLVTDCRSLSDAQTLLRPGMQLTNLDELDVALSSKDLMRPISADAPACVIYTSGSTGSPKGVVQTHRNLLHKTMANTAALQLTPRDRLTQLATCSVAQGLSTALQALLNGASVHPFDLRELGVGGLASWMIAHEITVFLSSASTFRYFAKMLTARDEFPALRVIRLGGEQILSYDFELYRRHFPLGCVFVSGFGSTETGLVTLHVMDHASHITDVVPAGYPLDGMTVMILDDAGGVRPAGEPGEIAVQSRFLSPGYWRDPDRTAAVFLDVPNEAGERLYRTGDVGRMRPDGCLEHLGRKDFRVKICGFRVELEEIERALCVHPLVMEAAVIARLDSLGFNRLAAYVVSRAGQPLTADHLRAHLRSTLPEQMVPASFEFLPGLPRVANGKVDRAALPAPEGASATVTLGRPPRDALELGLTNLWEDLLEQRPIGMSANFFELGGHSLLAARLSASIEQAFGTKLPLATFLRAATIEQQAELLRRPNTPELWPSLVPIRAGRGKQPFFGVHGVGGNILTYRELARYLPADQPIYGLQSRGLDGRAPVITQMEDMASHYVEEIRKVQPHGPYAIAGFSFGGLVAFEVARQLERQGQKIALLALFDTQAPGGPGRRQAPTLRSKASKYGALASLYARNLLYGPHRGVYVYWKVRRMFGDRLWEMLFRSHRRTGRSLPRALQDVKLANLWAKRKYRRQVYGGRVTLFRASEHSVASTRGPDYGWSPLAKGGVEILDVPGDHWTMVAEPHVRTLARKLARCLDEAWESERAAA